MFDLTAPAALELKHDENTILTANFVNFLIEKSTLKNTGRTFRFFAACLLESVLGGGTRPD